jgi:transcriptional regulator with XRE-family HTH domain
MRAAYIIYGGVMNQAIIPAQIRAARSLVNWSQEELAKAAEVALTSVRDIEGEKRAADSGTVANVRRALENEGVEFLAGAPEYGPGVRLLGNRPNLIRRPTVITMWEGMPIEVEFRGRTFDAFISYEVLEDLGRLTKKESEEVYFRIFDKHRGSILDAVRRAFGSRENWDKHGRLYIRGKDIPELCPQS